MNAGPKQRKQRTKRYMSSSPVTDKPISPTPLITTNCFSHIEPQKIIISVLLFIASYYLLVLAISMTQKKHRNKYITHRGLQHLELIGTDTNTLNADGYKSDDSDRQKELERRKKRRAERRSRLAEKRQRNRPKFKKLEPFPKLYISAAPYYLDNNLLIIGQLSNAEIHLQSVLNQLDSVSCLFNSTTFILFESNSIDSSPLILNTFARNTMNCSQMLYNPSTVSMYHNISSLYGLLSLFENKYSDSYSYMNEVDDAIYSVLNNCSSFDDIDLKEIEFEMSQRLRMHNDEHILSEIEMEEIVYDKLLPIKYVKYRSEILDRAYNHSVYKYIISGDEYLEEELQRELQILKELKLYDGVNEFHGGYNTYKEEDIIDFEREFSDIHKEIEALITNDEEIVYERLRDRRIRFAQKRMELRKQRQIEEDKEEEEHQRYDEYYTRFRDKLYRIERFVIYRNMLLDRGIALSKELNIVFDYVMVVDPDIYSMDISTFLNELYYSSFDGVCMDGIDWMGYTRDTFATVNMNGGWLHYGHDVIINNTQYIYNHHYANLKRKTMPSQNNRFESVKSCFGGVIVYKNDENDLFDSNCKYTLTRDIFYTKYIDTNITKYSYDYWLEHRQTKNRYSQQTQDELELFRKQYIELLQIEDKRIKRRELWPKDGDICEHIPFHYCLYDYGWRFAISTRSKIYYAEEYPINRPNDTNWINYHENRPSFTK